MERTQFAELHRHLDGSLRWRTLQELASRHGIGLPKEVEEIQFFQGMGLQAALDRFALTLRVLQHPDDVKRVATEICEDAKREGITTLEIRFAPHLHQGAPLEEIIDAACDGVGKRAGVLLCGLYGDPPALLEQFVQIAETHPEVVGIDLAGGPHNEQLWKLEDYRLAFTKARSLGIGRTIHAGEGRHPAEIRMAIEQLHANRIGHGTTLLDDPTLVNLVIERGITIEACVTSNMHVGAIPTIYDHPLPRWLDLGVRACICTDNTLFSDVDAPEEHRRVATIPGMTETKIKKAIAFGHEAAFSR